MALDLAAVPANHRHVRWLSGPVDSLNHARFPLSTAAGALFGPAFKGNSDIISHSPWPQNASYSEGLENPTISDPVKPMQYQTQFSPIRVATDVVVLSSSSAYFRRQVEEYPFPFHS